MSASVSCAMRANADGDRAPGTRSHSMQALSLLNELISTAKISSDTPNAVHPEPALAEAGRGPRDS
jgi:hypothetical protein